MAASLRRSRRGLCSHRPRRTCRRPSVRSLADCAHVHAHAHGLATPCPAGLATPCPSARCRARTERGRRRALPGSSGCTDRKDRPTHGRKGRSGSTGRMPGGSSAPTWEAVHASLEALQSRAEEAPALEPAGPAALEVAASGPAAAEVAASGPAAVEVAASPVGPTPRDQRQLQAWRQQRARRPAA